MNSEIKSMVNNELFKKEEEKPEQKQPEPTNKGSVKYKDIHEAMSDLKKTPQDVETALLELAQNGIYKETIEIVSELAIIFKIPNLISTDAILLLMEEEGDLMISQFQFKLGLFNLASILNEYNGKDIMKEVSEKLKLDGLTEIEKEESIIQAKANWIEKNIPLPIYQLIAKKAEDFQQFTYWIGTTEVYDFLGR